MRPLTFLVFLFNLSLLSATAEEGQHVVSSTLRSATVYRSGAELVHTAIAHLDRGANELVIGDLSNAIDISSVRVTCSSNVTVMSVTFSTDYLRPETVSRFVKKLQDSIAAIKKELTRLEVLSKSAGELLEVLNGNKTVGGTNTGVSVVELAKMIDYQRQKQVEIRMDISGYNERTTELNQLAYRLDSQIKEEEKKKASTGGSLVLQLLSPSAGPCDLTVSYLTTAAHWEPSYDLKVINSNDPLHLFYKAQVVQTSGIDWKQVKLSLSTSLPSQGGNAPVLKARFLRFVEAMRAVGYFAAPSPANTLDNKISGNYKTLALQESVVIRGAASVGAKDELGDYVTLNDRTMDAVFDIDIPYDVPGNGMEQGVVLKEYQLPCVYQYYAAPGVDKDAYLLGQLTGWEKLNLLPGEASIMVEGTYIGKSRIDPGSIQDTLNLTLGRDKRIVVKREKLVDYSSVKFLGSSKKQVYTFLITVRNNKKEKARMILKDQYPLSTDKDIETELLDSSGAVVNPDTGILTWNLELAPGESRSYRISYSVKYPKDKVLNIN
ncbi:DUF4139 domain-containing protein [Puia dinghuensis]|uniref:Membrane protein n=1 Tax=Puia dinghuensis TaxID=1792502 RepID=A0A8J2XR49_9BACT|nr:DUF4139 domain-containing protein [Puia dinghuensis]GGA87587.1 membrane protein [Puia dinghuensis]